MPKNKKVNGFWFFSQQMKPRLGLQGATNEVLLAATSKLWKVCTSIITMLVCMCYLSREHIALS